MPVEQLTPGSSGTLPDDATTLHALSILSTLPEDRGNYGERTYLILTIWPETSIENHSYILLARTREITSFKGKENCKICSNGVCNRKMKLVLVNTLQSLSQELQASNFFYTGIVAYYSSPNPL